MSHILSPEEIEALRRAIDEGDVDVEPEPTGPTPGGRGGRGAAGSYRFGQGPSEDAEVRNALEVIFTRATSGAEGWIVQLLERDMGFVLDALDTLPFGRFREDFRVAERPLAFVPFHAPAVGGDGLLVVEPGLLYPVVEGIMGGAAAAVKASLPPPPADRAPSMIDLRIAGRLARRVLSGLGAAWSEREAQRFEMRRVESDPRACRTIPDRAVVVAARYRAITAAADLGEMAVVVPDWMTRGLRPPKDKQRERDAVPAMEARLREMPVTITAELPPRVLTVRELLRLRVGDTLALDGGHRVRLAVEGVPRFTAVLGTSGGRRAVQVQQEIQGGFHE